MKAEQHIPNFISGADSESVYFDTVENLINIKWIKRWATFPEFHRFSMARDKTKDKNKQHILMAEFNDGNKWYVLAFIRDENINKLDILPEWTAKKDKLKSTGGDK